MRNHVPPAAIPICLFVMTLIVRGQDAGIGTFNNLVGQALESAPPPTPQAKTISAAGFTTTTAPTFNYQPGLEYDYRFNQEETGDHFSTDINEAHFSFSLFHGPTNLLAEYFHVWSDASNDVGLAKMINADGIKVMLTQTLFHYAPEDTSKIGGDIVVSFPSFFKQENLDALTSLGRQISDTDFFIMSPFVLFSSSWPLDKADKKRYRNLTLSVSPGFRLIISDKDFTNVNLSNVRREKGMFSLLPRVDYDITKTVSLNGSFTWTYLTNYHSSDSAAPPDANVFSLAAGVVVKPRLREEETESSARPLSLSLTYQYDGFNRDFYQHSITLLATYKF